MSKVDAYKCDYCEVIKDESEMVGIIPTEDLFDTFSSYPTLNNCKKCDIHLCTTCYNTHVLDVASRTIVRKYNEDGYKRKVSELGYSLRSQTVKKYRVNQH